MTSRSSCFSLQGAGIAGAHHRTQHSKFHISGIQIVLSPSAYLPPRPLLWLQTCRPSGCHRSPFGFLRGRSNSTGTRQSLVFPMGCFCRALQPVHGKFILPATQAQNISVTFIPLLSHSTHKRPGLLQWHPDCLNPCPLCLQSC